MQLLGLNFFPFSGGLQCTKGNFIKGKDSDATSGSKFSSYFITWRHFNRMNPLKKIETLTCFEVLVSQ